MDKAKYWSRENAETTACKDTYQGLENETYNKLFDYVRQDTLEKQKVCLVTNLTSFTEKYFGGSIALVELAERKSDKDKTINLVNDAACLIRSEVKSLDTNLSWPP